MRTVAIINQKGGCGKTTTAINLGACLAYLKKRILVVDLDPQAHATLGFGINPGEYSRSIYDLLISDEKDAGLMGDVIMSITDNLDLIPSDVMLSAAEPILLQRENREYYLSKTLDALNDRYDFILIDCPPNIGILTFNALHACTEAIIPMESGLFALHGLAKLLETVDIINLKRASGLTAYALATMYDRRTRIARESLEELRSHMQGHVFKTVINLNVKLREAAGYGLSIIQYDPGSQGSSDYQELAREMMAISKLKKMKPREEGKLLKPVITKDGVLFTYYSPKASQVHVVADFNGWKVGELPMENMEGTGLWQKMVPLGKGEYEYKFYVDGQWVSDPENPNRSVNEFGENSKIEIK